jgi:hypothetical protein
MSQELDSESKAPKMKLALTSEGLYKQFLELTTRAQYKQSLVGASIEGEFIVQEKLDNASRLPETDQQRLILAGYVLQSAIQLQYLERQQHSPQFAGGPPAFSN